LRIWRTVVSGSSKQYAMHNELKEWIASRHAYFGWAVEQVQRTGDRVVRDERFSDLATALAAHLRSVEHGTSRALRRVAHPAEQFAVRRRYEAVASALADALNARASRIGFAQAFRALASAVTEMCAIEREQVVPLLSDRLANTALTLVAVQMEQHFDGYVGIVGIDGLPTHAVEPAERFFDPAEATQPAVRHRVAHE
jgi:hypothetical protein